MKPLWFIGGMAVAAILLVGLSTVAAYTGNTSGNNLQLATETIKSDGCGCSHAGTAGSCGAAQCGAGCSECKNGCGGGCSGGCAK